MNKSAPSFVAVLLAATFLFGASQNPGANRGESDQPFAVFVHEPKDDENKDNDLIIDTTEKIIKKFAGQDDWFRLVDNPLDAEVRVEVLKAWYVIGRTGRTYHIEYSYSIPDQFERIVELQGIDLGSIAEKVTTTVKKICDTYCR